MNEYYQSVCSALDQADIATPRLIIDRARLDANLDILLSRLPAEMAFRVVVKSLPSPELISRIMRRASTNRLMTFNLPMLKHFSEHSPMADQLLGKPLPAKALSSYYSKVRPRNVQAHSNIQWLVDTPARLDQYLQIAEGNGTKLRINLELDVGMHRGGFEPGDELNAVLERLKASEFADLSGFMGYEPHIPLLPGDNLQASERVSAQKIYKAALEAAETRFGFEAVKGMCRNAAGSPTFRLWEDTQIANEISVGSALVKPTGFDTPLLSDFEPASFIASPVLKSTQGFRLPSQPVSARREATTVFMYGGNWMAEPVYPAGLEFSSEFGRSSNQDLLLGPAGMDVKPDDFVVLRPKQSEAVFLQFGSILVFDNGQIVDEWPVLPASA